MFLFLDPWFLAKAFDTSCPVAKFVEKSKIVDPHQLELVCYVNGQIRQREKTDKVKLNNTFKSQL